MPRDFIAASADAEWVTAVGTCVTALILLVTAILVLRQLKEARERRQTELSRVEEAQKARFAQLAADLTRRWDEPLLRDSREAMSALTADGIQALVKRIYQGNASADDAGEYYRLQALPNFIESVAVFEDEFAGLSLELVDRLWGGAIIRAWDRWELATTYVQSQPNAQHVYAEFQQL